MKKIISISFLITILVLISGSKFAFANDSFEKIQEDKNEIHLEKDDDEIDDDYELDDDDNISITKKITPKSPLTKPSLTITPIITNNNTTSGNLNNTESKPISTPTPTNESDVNQELSSLNSNNDLFYEFKKLLASLQKIIFTILS